MKNNFHSIILKDVKPSKLSAFSLIELSIVLIIIGLLVAGVTGGKSLIDSARNRAFINEIKGYEQAVWTFKAARGRYPGDIGNYGNFGQYTTNTYTDKLVFAPPYNKPTVAIDVRSAPFIELYTEGIIDFKPSTTTIGEGNGFPWSKVFNKAYIYFVYTGANSAYKGTPTDGELSYKGIANQGIQELLYYHYTGNNPTTGFDPKAFKFVDEKIDDGLYWNGRIRGGCYDESENLGTNSYDNTIENKKKCGYLYYTL